LLLAGVIKRTCAVPVLPLWGIGSSSVGACIQYRYPSTLVSLAVQVCLFCLFACLLRLL